MSTGGCHALDDFRDSAGSMASWFQLAYRRSLDPLAAGRRVSDPGH